MSETQDLVADPAAPRKRGKHVTNTDAPTPREAGTWIAKHPDGGMSAHTSKKEALRKACIPGSWGFVPFGLVIPDADISVADIRETHGVWVARNKAGGRAPFEREMGALEFACPEGGVQFVKSGGVIQL